MKNLKTLLQNLVSKPGVYQMLDGKGRVIYVGKAKNLKNRVSSYFSGSTKDPKTALLLKNIADIDITVTQTENEAILLECNLIKKHHPRFNVLLRDDKSYPYIGITDHKFPRILMYRGQKRKGGQYFGPFPSSMAVRETINLLQKLFRLRTCRDSFFSSRARPCLLYQINRCTGPCVDYISEEDYAESVKMASLFLQGKSQLVTDILKKRMQEASSKQQYEIAVHYRDQLTSLSHVQEKQFVAGQGGDADVIAVAIKAGVASIHVLTIRQGQISTSRSFFPKTPEHVQEEDILSAFIKQFYLSHTSNIPRQIIVNHQLNDVALLAETISEQAGRKSEIFIPRRGEKKKWLNIAAASVSQALAAHLYSNINMRERLESLRQTLGLAAVPKRIECYDISHSSGEATVASCVVFDHSGPLKSDYRRFNIKDIVQGDDVAAIRQVIYRRFKKLELSDAMLPDLVIIDGGKGQLNAAQKVLDELNLSGLSIIGVSKGSGRKAGFESIHQIDLSPMHLPADSLALHLIQHIRDEAHRFAIMGHRAKRDKARVHSVLEEIAGIGPKKRRALIRKFGGIKGIARASLDELLGVPGITQSLADKIIAAFHEETD